MTTIRICRECGQEKDLETGFYRTRIRNGVPHYATICKTCRDKQAKAWQRTHPENMRARDARIYAKRKASRQNPADRARWVLEDCVRSDRKKGHTNDLTYDFVAAQIARGCIYCGSTDRVGLDRVNNALGHMQRNVLPACTVCNYFRRDMPFAAWLRIAPVLRQAKEDGLLSGWNPTTRKRREGL
jgi:hypothetical protein